MCLGPVNARSLQWPASSHQKFGDIRKDSSLWQRFAISIGVFYGSADILMFQWKDCVEVFILDVLRFPNYPGGSAVWITDGRMAPVSIAVVYLTVEGSSSAKAHRAC